MVVRVGLGRKGEKGVPKNANMLYFIAIAYFTCTLHFGLAWFLVPVCSLQVACQQHVFCSVFSFGLFPGFQKKCQNMSVPEGL